MTTDAMFLMNLAISYINLFDLNKVLEQFIVVYLFSLMVRMVPKAYSS